MKVYVLMHDDRSYDMGDTFLRGIYATREEAEAFATTYAFYEHSPHKALNHVIACCSVEEWEIGALPVHYGQPEKPLPVVVEGNSPVAVR